MKKTLFAILLYGALSPIKANNDSTITQVIDTAIFKVMPEDTLTPVSNFSVNLDSLVQLWYVDQFAKVDSLENRMASDSIPRFSDSVYMERLSAIPAIMDLSYNRIVRNYIEMYTTKKRESVEKMLGLSEHYFPIFDEIFDYYDVPNELKYMSIIESALNPKAYSRARAVGLWQFMYGTGRMYGLEINSLVDERRDPIKSTHAAVRFTKDLYNIYGDWTLVIAAYNCGPGNVNKAIRRAGGKRNYWDIYYYLPRETRGHVPAFIAAAYTMNYYAEHNLSPKEIQLPLLSDTIIVNQELHLKQVSDVLGVPMKQLRDLNPQYRYDIVPAKNKTYALRLPAQYALPFIDLQDSIYAHKDSIYFSEEKLRSAPKKNDHLPYAPGKDYKKLIYEVKSGDNLGFIASWYNVRVSDIRYWNNIHKNMIRTGQKLAIYKKKGVASKYADINSLSFAQKQARIGKPTATKTTTAPPPTDLGTNYLIYTVRSGDTLWEIAKKYPGVSDTDIMRWNNITSAGKIKPGQKLKIKKVG